MSITKNCIDIMLKYYGKCQNVIVLSTFHFARFLKYRKIRIPKTINMFDQKLTKMVFWKSDRKYYYFFWTENKTKYENGYQKPPKCFPKISQKPKVFWAILKGTINDDHTIPLFLNYCSHTFEDVQC